VSWTFTASERTVLIALDGEVNGAPSSDAECHLCPVLLDQEARGAPEVELVHPAYL
jgi:hypothetical protein